MFKILAIFTSPLGYDAKIPITTNMGKKLGIGKVKRMNCNPVYLRAFLKYFAVFASLNA